jgi:hypothetical protein
MMSKRCAIACILASFTVASPALAASVQDLQGTVQVDRGNGFRTVTGSQIVADGNRVMVGNTGGATIVYDNGCRERVKPGQIVVVSTPACQAANVDGGANAGGLGGVGASATTGAALVGGMVIAIGTLGLTAPISP